MATKKQRISVSFNKKDDAKEFITDILLLWDYLDFEVSRKGFLINVVFDNDSSLDAKSNIEFLKHDCGSSIKPFNWKVV